LKDELALHEFLHRRWPRIAKKCILLVILQKLCRYGKAKEQKIPRRDRKAALPSCSNAQPLSESVFWGLK